MLTKEKLIPYIDALNKITKEHGIRITSDGKGQLYFIEDKNVTLATVIEQTSTIPWPVLMLYGGLPTQTKKINGEMNGN